MANTKSPFYVTIATGVAFEVQLDPDIYTAAVLAATGITATKPAKVFPISLRYLLRSGLAAYTKKRITKGTGEEKKVRSYQFLTEAANLDTSAAALNGLTVNVGNGAGVAWTIA